MYSSLRSQVGGIRSRDDQPQSGGQFSHASPSHLLDEYEPCLLGRRQTFRRLWTPNRAQSISACCHVAIRESDYQGRHASDVVCDASIPVASSIRGAIDLGIRNGSDLGNVVVERKIPSAERWGYLRPVAPPPSMCSFFVMSSRGIMTSIASAGRIRRPVPCEKTTFHTEIAKLWICVFRVGPRVGSEW